MSLTLRTISREQHLAYIQSLPAASHMQVPAWGDVKAEWRGRAFELVDTGGMVPGEAAEIPSQIVTQAKVAIETAAVVVMVVDGRSELTANDRELANAAFHAGDLLDQKPRVLRGLHCLIYGPLAMRGQLVYRIGVIDQREDERQNS